MGFDEPKQLMYLMESDEPATWSAATREKFI